MNWGNLSCPKLAKKMNEFVARYGYVHYHNLYNIFVERKKQLFCLSFSYNLLLYDNNDFNRHISTETLLFNRFVVLFVLSWSRNGHPSSGSSDRFSRSHCLIFTCTHSAGFDTYICRHGRPRAKKLKTFLLYLQCHHYGVWIIGVYFGDLYFNGRNYQKVWWRGMTIFHCSFRENVYHRLKSTDEDISFDVFNIVNTNFDELFQYCCM